MFDKKNELKESLTIDDVFSLVAEMGGEPRMDRSRNFFTALTICHQGDSHKLYYYDNTHLFKCFTNCGNFDIFELVLKVKRNEGIEWALPRAIQYVTDFFGLSDYSLEENEEQEKLPDWEILNKYNKNNSTNNNEKQKVELKIYDKDILKYFPHPHIIPWEREEISRDIMERRGICYDPISQSILIPHYNINGELIGIRSRVLNKEDEETFGKYHPWKLGLTMFNHPLGFNLYNLNYSKDNIKAFKISIIFEGKRQSRPSLLFSVTAEGCL